MQACADHAVKYNSFVFYVKEFSQNVLYVK